MSTIAFEQVQTFEYSEGLIISLQQNAYVHLNPIAEKFGKRIDNWTCLESVKELLVEFENLTPSDLRELKNGQTKALITVQGRQHGGTWVHPDIAIQFCQWCSPKFALWVSKVIRCVLVDGYYVNYGQAQNELAEMLEGTLRTLRVKAYRSWTDIIKERLESQGLYQNKDYTEQIFKRTAISVNRTLFNVNSFGGDRDKMDSEQQKLIFHFENCLTEQARRHPEMDVQGLIDQSLKPYRVI